MTEKLATKRYVLVTFAPGTSMERDDAPVRFDPLDHLIPSVSDGGGSPLQRKSGAPEGLAAAWGELGAWITAQGHTPGPDLWECYLAGPESNPDPTTWRTELNRPLID